MQKYIAKGQTIKCSYDFNQDIRDLYNDINQLLSTLDYIYGSWSDEDIDELDSIIGPKLYDALIFAKQDLSEEL